MKLDEKTLQDLKDKKIQIEDLNECYFLESDSYADIEIENILKLLNNNICDFKQIIDKFEEFKRLYYVLAAQNKKMFIELFENNKLSNDDLKHLLNKIDDREDIFRVCENHPLVKYILKEFVFDKEIVNKFSTLLKLNENLFDEIEYHATHYWNDDGSDYWDEFSEESIDKELLKLNELNRYMYAFDLTKEQSSELIEVLKNNELAQNRLMQIVDNNLELNYDFNQLMNYLSELITA